MLKHMGDLVENGLGDEVDLRQLEILAVTQWYLENSSIRCHPWPQVPVMKYWTFHPQAQPVPLTEP